MTYAVDTKVSVEKTKAVIDALVMKRGADNFASFSSRDAAQIAFQLDSQQILFKLPLPARDDQAFTHSKRGARTADAAHTAWEQACRSNWRALFLAIRAKFESIDAGIETYEEAFLPHIMTPDG